MDELILYKEIDGIDEYLYVYIPYEYDLDGAIWKLNKDIFIEITAKNNPEYEELFLSLETSIKNLNSENHLNKLKVIAELLHMYNLGRNSAFNKLKQDIVCDVENLLKKLKLF